MSKENHRRFTPIPLAPFAAAPTPGVALADPPEMTPLAFLPGDLAAGVARGSQTRSVVARGGDRLLAVWIDASGANSLAGVESDLDLVAARLDAGGALLDLTPFVLSRDCGYQRDPQVAWNGARWLVAWENQTFPGSHCETRIYAARVSPEGTVLDAAPMQPPGADATDEFHLAANGSEGLIGTQNDSAGQNGIRGRRMAADGSFPDAAPTLIVPGGGSLLSSVDLDAASGEYLLTSSGSSSIVGLRLSATLAPLGTVTLPWTRQRVASNGAMYHVLWNGRQYGNEMRGSPLSITGVFTIPAGAFFDDLSDGAWWSHDIAWNGTYWWFGYDHAWTGLTLQRAAANGTVVDALGFAIDSPHRHDQGRPRLAARPSGGVLVVWQDSRIAGAAWYHIFAARLTGPAPPLDPGAPISRSASPQTCADLEPIQVASGPSELAPAAAWNGSCYLCVWSSASTVVGRRIGAEGSFLDPAPIGLGNSFSRFTRVASFDGRRLVTGQRNFTHDDPQSSVEAAFVEPSGAASASFAVLFMTGGTPDVAVSDGTVLFLWRNNSLADANHSIAARRLRPDGSFVDASPFTVSEAPGRPLDPVCAGNGAGFVTAWEDQRNQTSFFNGRTEPFGARVPEVGAVIGPTGYGVIDVVRPVVSPTIASLGGGPWLVAASVLRPDVPFAGYRIGVPAAGVGSAGAPRQREPPRSVWRCLSRTHGRAAKPSCATNWPRRSPWISGSATRRGASCGASRRDRLPPAPAASSGTAAMTAAGRSVRAAVSSGWSPGAHERQSGWSWLVDPAERRHVGRSWSPGRPWHHPMEETDIMTLRIPIALFAVILLAAFAAGAQAQDLRYVSWRYYRPGNTGIQGDYCDALWIDQNGDPWIGGYVPSFEEGGVAHFLQAENRWGNVSNVDYPVIGHPDLTGTARVSDIEQDAEGRLWMSTWRSVLRMDPAVGPSSLVNFASSSPAIANGGCRDLDISPDGKIWFALIGFGGSAGGIVRHTPGTNDWHFWTGGNPPQGGNNWPILVWSVNSVSIQPKPDGGYIVWGDADNGASVVSFDSGTQLWTYHEFSYTPGSILDLLGRESVDSSGNLWAVRFVRFNGSVAVYSIDYRRIDGTWVTPPQPPGGTDVVVFRAFGDRQALLINGAGRVYRFNGTAWSDLGIWRDGGFSSDVIADELGNVWASGTGGAARRDAITGLWQRFRITNTSQYDLFNNDLSIDPATGHVYACANAGPGYGGMTMFDGTRWIGFNNYTYGLGVPWPFPSDNSNAVGFRPSNGSIAVNPMYGGIYQWNGTSWTNLNGMSESRGLVEDSMGRLWSLGSYFSLAYYNGSIWTTVPNNGTWGNNIQKDPDRPGTVWVSTYAEVIRTDGTYRFSRTYDQFPELNTQSDIFGTVAAGPGGIAWLGSTQGMFKLNANTGAYQYFTQVGGYSCIGASPLAVTPDGRVWFAMFDPGGYNGTPHGLLWFDGVNAGYFPAPVNGEPQWGGLPHAQIYACQVRTLPGAYELWLSCASRGIAVLTVTYQDPADVAEGGGAPGPVLGPSRPHPFRFSTVLSFDLLQADRARLAVYDLQGRLIRSLVDGPLPAGTTRFSWDARDDNGRAVPAGVYFWKLNTGGGEAVCRTTLVR